LILQVSAASAGLCWFCKSLLVLQVSVGLLVSAGSVGLGFWEGIGVWLGSAAEGIGAWSGSAAEGIGAWSGCL